MDSYEAGAMVIMALSVINAVLLTPVYVILSNLRADQVQLRDQVAMNGRRISHVEGQLNSAGFNDDKHHPKNIEVV